MPQVPTLVERIHQIAITRPTASAAPRAAARHRQPVDPRPEDPQGAEDRAAVEKLAGMVIDYHPYDTYKKDCWTYAVSRRSRPPGQVAAGTTSAPGAGCPAPGRQGKHLTYR
jgi:hypothetical protein